MLKRMLGFPSRFYETSLKTATHQNTNSIQFNPKLDLSFQQIESKMSVKMYFLHSHLYYFCKNCGDYSKGQEKRFNQDICTWKLYTTVGQMETHYNGGLLLVIKTLWSQLTAQTKILLLN